MAVKKLDFRSMEDLSKSIETSIGNPSNIHRRSIVDRLLSWVSGVDLEVSGVDLGWIWPSCALPPSANIYRKSIEHLSKIYRTSIEHLSNIYRKSIEHLSNIYRKSIEIQEKCFFAKTRCFHMNWSSSLLYQTRREEIECPLSESAVDTFSSISRHHIQINRIAN